MIVVEGVRLLRDRRAGETLKSETYECGSPPAPRKASTWNVNQLLPKSNIVCENSPKKSIFLNGKCF
ncbi:hypothetical protein QUF49_10575 [Fictibacillus sp. b24]|uniref:hypothetical protein n=1 Tax=Fictibacillus sp. b24 TaxID=3055863 RepID=UPI0025A08F4D|nr:hypothetical protein [Fictibacillus sp. b24]MDM5316436.1 hypothetical protein [Fictibacillus sp. b24]